MTDPLYALLALLVSDATIKGLASTRVYGLEVPRPESDAMPRALIVVKPAGLGAAVEHGSYAQLTSTRFDVWNYGETPAEAHALHLASYDVLKNLQRRVVAGVLLHSAERTGGPIPIRDPIALWPISIETFDVLASDVAIT